jgi:hypothetical protein
MPEWVKKLIVLLRPAISIYPPLSYDEIKELDRHLQHIRSSDISKHVQAMKQYKEKQK